MFMVMALSMVTVSAAGESVDDAYVVNITDVSHQELTEGREYKIQMTVENAEWLDWRDMYFKLDFGSAPIYVIDSNDGYYLEYFNGKESYTLEYNVKVGEGASGDCKATMTVNGISESLKDMNVTKEIYFHVNEAQSNMNFYGEVENDTVLKSDELTEMNVILSAEGIGKMSNISLTVDSDNSGLAIQDGFQFDQVMFTDGVYTAPIKVKAFDSLESGFYTLLLTLNYNEEGNINKTFEEVVEVIVEVDNDDSVDVKDVTIAPISVSDSSLYVGQTATLSTAITNHSDESIDELIVSLDYSDAVVPRSQDTVVLHDLASGASENVAFTVEATDDASTRNYSLGIKVSNDDVSKQLFAGVYVYNDEDDEDENVSEPKLMITNYSTGADKLFAGESFDLSLTIMNTNKNMTINNIKITVAEETSGTTSKVFVPYGISSSVYVDALAPKEEVEVDLSYMILDQAEGDIYNLSVTYDYEDVDANGYEDSESLTIPVYQVPELTISDVAFGSVLDSGFTIEADFYNTGKIDIDNMMVDVELEGYNTNNSNYYVGTFESGRTDTYDVDIVGTKPDSLSGKLVFTYDDTFGAQVEVVKEFTIGTGTGASGAVGSNAGNTSTNAAGADTVSGKAAGAGSGQGARGGVELPDGVTQEQVREAMQSGLLTMEDMQAGDFSALTGSTGFLGMDTMTVAIVGGIAVLVLAVSVIGIRKRKAGKVE